MLRLHLIWWGSGSGSWICTGKKWIRPNPGNFFKILQLLVDILPLGSGSVDPHIFADPDPESQNLADPDPKHCSFYDYFTYLMFYIFPIPYNIFFPRNLKYLVNQSIKYLIHPPLKLDISSVSVLQITTVQHRKFSLVGIASFLYWFL